MKKKYLRKLLTVKKVTELRRLGVPLRIGSHVNGKRIWRKPTTGWKESGNYFVCM